MVEDINEVKKIILDYSKSTTIITNKIIIDAIPNGKMIRPLLLLLFAKLINVKNKDCIILAAVVEMIHMATLLHDDVLDNAMLRRKKATIKAKMGDHFAILSGDFLYSRAFRLLVQVKSKYKIKICSLLAEVTNIMVEGEMLQAWQKNNFAITKKSYMQIINYKTARLFAMTTQLPSILITNNNIAKYSFNFGLHFGMAYQLLNDIADYYNTNNDLLEGRITLPVIFVLNKLNNNKLKQKFINLIKKFQHAEIKNFIYEYGGFEYTFNLAEQYLIKAVGFVNLLKNNNNSKYIKDILQITEKLLLSNKKYHL